MPTVVSTYSSYIWWIVSIVTCVLRESFDKHLVKI